MFQFLRNYDELAFRAGFYDGMQDNSYKLNNSVCKRSYRAGYRSGQKSASRRQIFIGSVMSFNTPLTDNYAE